MKLTMATIFITGIMLLSGGAFFTIIGVVGPAFFIGIGVGGLVSGVIVVISGVIFVLFPYDDEIPSIESQDSQELQLSSLQSIIHSNYQPTFEDDNMSNMSV